MHSPERPDNPVSGYEARIVDDDMNELRRAAVGSLRFAGLPDAAISPMQAAKLCARWLESDRRFVRPRRRMAACPSCSDPTT